jgi:hypothetical protein
MLLNHLKRKFKNSARSQCVLGFFFVLVVVSCKTPKPAESSVVSPPMTVLNLSMEQDGEQISWKVSFKQSQRIYILPGSKEDDRKLLEDSKKNGTAVTIARSDDHSNVILSVKKAE